MTQAPTAPPYEPKDCCDLYNSVMEYQKGNEEKGNPKTWLLTNCDPNKTCPKIHAAGTILQFKICDFIRGIISKTLKTLCFSYMEK